LGYEGVWTCDEALSRPTNPYNNRAFMRPPFGAGRAGSVDVPGKKPGGFLGGESKPDALSTYQTF